MAIEYEDNCVGCGIVPCNHCKKLVMYCDHCGEAFDELFWFGDDQICEECYRDESINNAKKVTL